MGQSINESLREAHIALLTHHTQDQALERLKKLDLGSEEVQAARRACGCMACEACRPEIAHVAQLCDLPFLNVLVYVLDAEREAIERLVLAWGPKRGDRAERRRRERLIVGKVGKGQTARQKKIQERRDRLAAIDLARRQINKVVPDPIELD